MKVIKYFSYTLLFVTIFLVIAFFNLGHFLDVTKEPIKSDVIVCLGGGSGERIKKSLELYKKGYSTSKLLILTADNRTKKEKDLNMDDKRISYIKEQNFSDINIAHEKDNIKSTRDEMLFIKNYMLENNYSSVIIVSDIPHSRRIKSLLSILNVKNDGKLSFNLVGSDLDWWDNDTYYKNKKGQVFAMYESLKLIHTYIAYGFLEKIGLLPIIQETFEPLFSYIKKDINKSTYFYLKEKK